MTGAAGRDRWRGSGSHFPGSDVYHGDMKSRHSILPALIALALFAVLAAATAPSPPDGPVGCGTMAGPGDTVSHDPAGWKDVDRLIGEQKYRAALDVVRSILDRTPDPEERTRAILKAAQLEAGLGGFETAVRFLRTTQWPEEARYRAQLELASIDALSTYLDWYSWDIGQREEVISTDEPDISRWTRRQILAEIGASFARLWAQREQL